MKKYLIILAAITCVAWYGPHQVTSKSSESLPETCTEGTTTDVCTTSSGQDTVSQGYSYGFTFTVASARSDYGIALRINVASGTVNTEVRLGTSANLSTYTARAFAAVTSTDTNNYEDFAWEDADGNPMKVDFVTSTNYYVGAMPTDGAIRWQRGEASCSNMSLYQSTASGWNMDFNNTNDPNWKYIGCAE